MSRITCPSTLPPEAKKEWRRILKIYNEDSKEEFSPKDLKALERYCLSYSDVITFSEKLKETGYLIFSDSGYPQQHPYFNMRNKAIEEMRSWMKELGFTPAARARINKKTVTIIEDLDPEMEEMISK